MKRIIILFTSISIALSAMAENNILIVYFSNTDTTRRSAEKLSKDLNAAIWEIEAAEPYTAADLNWRNNQSRSNLEMADSTARPMIKQCTDITPYKDIYLGFPIWWGICPRIIQSWVDNNIYQLEGKRIFPFCTSGGSGVEPAVRFLKEQYPSLNWQAGKRM